MPLPKPELTGEDEGMLTGGVKEIVSREGHGCGLEDTAGKTNERNDKYDFEGVYDVVAKLRCGYVEAQHKGYGEAEDGGATENRVDPDEEADGQAPGQFFRRCSHTKEREDGEGDAAIEPVVVNRCGASAVEVEIGFVGLHC